VSGERERALVPEADPRSYYGRPVIKKPVWTWEIPVYLFTGGMSGAGAGLAYLSELHGNKVLARRSWGIAFGAGAISPVLLISDLGKPTRFLNMLRVFKVTSPMSVGSWVLSLVGASAAVSTANTLGGFFPSLAKAAKPTAAAAGMPLSTYAATLVSNTSIPAWHEARLTLPFLFAGGAAASAGATATMATPAKHAAPARRLALLGAAAELAATRVMEQQLGELGEPYHRGQAGALSRAAQLLTGLGGMTLAGFGRRKRSADLAGAGAVLAGSFLERWAVYKAGFQSASDPKYTVGPQRERIRSGDTRSASRAAAKA
jgi:formate-dependent nitrite reductase membrane component NrfD